MYARARVGMVAVRESDADRGRRPEPNGLFGSNASNRLPILG